jgi:hypothetical protein
MHVIGALLRPTTFESVEFSKNVQNRIFCWLFLPVSPPSGGLASVSLFSQFFIKKDARLNQSSSERTYFIVPVRETIYGLSQRMFPIESSFKQTITPHEMAPLLSPSSESVSSIFNMATAPTPAVKASDQD